MNIVEILRVKKKVGFDLQRTSFSGWVSRPVPRLSRISRKKVEKSKRGIGLDWWPSKEEVWPVGAKNAEQGELVECQESTDEHFIGRTFLF